MPGRTAHLRALPPLGQERQQVEDADGVPSLSKSGRQGVAYGKQVPQGLPPATEHHSASSMLRSNESTQPSGTPPGPVSPPQPDRGGKEAGNRFAGQYLDWWPISACGSR